MSKLNIPSYSALIPRDKQIKSIIDLYENVKELEEGGGGSSDAVLYTPQTLTTAQQTQARTNIDTYSKSEVNSLVTTPSVNYVTVSSYSNLPATGSADTIYRVANYDGSQVTTDAYAEYAWDGSAYVLLDVRGYEQYAYSKTEIDQIIYNITPTWEAGVYDAAITRSQPSSTSYECCKVDVSTYKTIVVHVFPVNYLVYLFNEGGTLLATLGTNRTANTLSIDLTQYTGIKWMCATNYKTNGNLGMDMADCYVHAIDTDTLGVIERINGLSDDLEDESSARETLGRQVSDIQDDVTEEQNFSEEVADHIIGGRTISLASNSATQFNLHKGCQYSVQVPSASVVTIKTGTISGDTFTEIETLQSDSGNTQLYILPDYNATHILANVGVTITAVADKDFPQYTKDLYIGDVLQNELTTTPVLVVGTSSAKKVCSKNLLVVPDKTRKLIAHLPTGISCAVRCTTYYPSSVQNNGFHVEGGALGSDIRNGYICLFEDNIFFYMLEFSRINGNDLSVTDVENWIADGSIRFTYIDDIPIENTYERNHHKESKVIAATGGNKTRAGVIRGTGTPDLFTFVELGDVHGDAARLENALLYADKLGIPYLIGVGDYCVDVLSDGVSYLSKIAAKHTTQVIPAIGNHDHAASRTGMTTASTADIVANILTPFVTLGSIPDVNSKTYYYKDIVWKDVPGNQYPIRVIVIDTYEGTDWSKTYTSQTQAEWFVSALAGVSANYGVIVVMHNFEKAASTSASPVTVVTGAEGFVQTMRRNAIKGITNTPFSKIVDLWQSRSSGSVDFYDDSGSSVAFSVSCNFTSVPTSTEFICFLNGHEHYDIVGYNTETTNRQLVLNVCCSAGYSVFSGQDTLSASGDLARLGGTITEDAFNIISVDRVNKTVKIVRIGADINIGFVERDFCRIAY